MVISIHQPNFIPWYPFFQKIQNSDIFVILINCQFEKNNFQNRFNLDEKWYTLSVNKGLEPIKDKRYVNPIDDWVKIKQRLPQYKDILPLFDSCISTNLADTNIQIIHKLCDILNIKTKIVIDYPTELKSTERLIDICKKHSATKYLAGTGCKAYLEVNKFNDVDVQVEFQQPELLIRKPILKYLNNE